MKYIIYKTTNSIDGKIYIGCHVTEDVNDDYMGSGKYLKNAIDKHGIENFQKEILHVFDTLEEMFEMESELVNEDFVSRKDTYNLKCGGCGGFDHLNIPENIGQKSEAGKIAGLVHKRKLETDEEYREQHNKRAGDIFRKAHKEGKIRYDGFKGKRHTEETKRKMSEKAKITSKGSGNSQYGTMWITNEVESKKIRKGEEIPEGWRKGRIIGH